MSAAFGVGASFTLSTKMTGCGNLPALELESELLVDRVEDADAVRSGAREQSRWGPLDREIPFALKTGLIQRATAAVRNIDNKARQIVHRDAAAVDYLLRDSVRGGSLRLPLAIRGSRGVRSRASFWSCRCRAESTNPGSSFESLWILRLNRSASSV